MNTSPPKERTSSVLRIMLGGQAGFHPGQWEAIETVAIQNKRVLSVQGTDRGKSLVYFLATKLMSEQGARITGSSFTGQ